MRPVHLAVSNAGNNTESGFGMTKEGEVFYTDRGITLVFVLSATVALIGAVAAYALPRSIRELTLPDADARTSPTRSAANA